MNPVLKRFLKGLVAAAAAGLIAYSVNFLQTNPLALGTATALVTGVLLALEKSVPNNL